MNQVIEFHVLFYVAPHFLDHDPQLYTQSGSLIITIVSFLTLKQFSKISFDINLRYCCHFIVK